MQRLGSSGAQARRFRRRRARYRPTSRDEPGGRHTYNNFYEFGTDKGDPAANARHAQDHAMDGQGRRARRTSRRLSTLEDFSSPSPLEERVYRMRCVEGWSMVIPWVGFALAEVLKRAEPTAQRQVCGVRDAGSPRGDAGTDASSPLDWPYVEGLRLDEAMHPSGASSPSGLYGEALPNQNGAPIRLVVPVEIRLQGHQVDRARSAWSSSSRQRPGTSRTPQEYGFYSNVNPEVDHPRWSQATERRIGEGGFSPSGAPP